MTDAEITPQEEAELLQETTEVKTEEKEAAKETPAKGMFISN